ncbi:MAG: hypothetical protein KC590_16870 [Nitrospira sp.]|nr:hypothetical protein [Nitrospira sp.]
MQDLQKAKQEIMDRAKGIPQSIENATQFNEAEALYVLLQTEHRKWEKVFKENIVDPAKRHYEDAKVRAKTLLEPLANGKGALNNLIQAYREKERQRIQAEQDKLNSQYNKKVDKAIQKGKDPLDVPPPAIVQGPAKSSDTSGGRLTYRKVTKLIEVDATLTPDEYCEKLPIKRMIEAALKAGKAVPGWRLEEREELATRAICG